MKLFPSHRESDDESVGVPREIKNGTMSEKEQYLRDCEDSQSLYAEALDLVKGEVTMEKLQAAMAQVRENRKNRGMSDSQFRRCAKRRGRTIDYSRNSD